LSLFSKIGDDIVEPQGDDFEHERDIMFLIKNKQTRKERKKMKKKLTKTLALLLAMMLCLSACATPDNKETTKAPADKTTEAKPTDGQTEGGEQTTEAPTEAPGITYPLEGNPTFTIWIQERKQMTNQYPNYADSPFVKAWQEATGVTLKIEQFPNYKSMNLAFGSGELPDIILFHWTNYSGGITKAVKDKVVLPITDYMEFAPDLAAVMAADANARRANKTQDGEVIGFPTFASPDEKCGRTNGMIVRQEYLDQVKMEVPNTLDELYAVLKAFKDQLNVEAPLSVNSSQLMYLLEHGMWTSPFGYVKSSEYAKDGKIKYGYYDDYAQFKESVAFLKKLYDEKLLDNNFITNPDVNANFMNGVTGMTFCATASGLNKILTTMEGDANFHLAAMPSITKNESDRAMSGYYAVSSGFYAVVTPECKDIENAVKFLNYGYTDEGHMLMNFGVEGESYTMVDGYPKYTELITNNPDGLNMQYALGPFVPMITPWATAVQDVRYFDQYSGMPEQQAALEVYMKDDATDYFVHPTVRVADELLSEYNTLIGDINTYVKETVINCIAGKMTMEQFDKEFVSTLERMNIKRVIEIRQAAYDAWLAN